MKTESLFSLWILYRDAYRKIVQGLLGILDARPYLIGLAGLCVSLAILAGSAMFLYVDRESQISLAQHRAENVATVLATSIGANISLYDALLRGMVSEAENPDTPVLPENVKDRLSFGQQVSNFLLDDANVISKDGFASAQFHGMAAHDLDLNDRQYFTVHKANPAVGLYISAPFSSRTRQGRISIALSRRIEDPEHHFAGVAMVALRLDTLTSIVRTARLADVESLRLVRSDGSELVSVRGGTPDSGTPFADLKHRDPAAPGATAEKLTQVPGAPLSVAVTPAFGATLHRWRVQAVTQAMLVGLFAAALTVGSLLLESALLDRRRAMDELLALSVTDGLTGLSNRRALDSRLDTEWCRHIRTGEPLSVLFIDIDRFKLFNDRYGHDTGDEVLRVVAQRIDAHARRGLDMTARYGGEEFAVILPATDAAGALGVAESIRHDIEAQKIEHAGSDAGSLTVSVGCATVLTQTGVDPAVVLRAADAQLLMAKAEGRNRVRSAVLDAGRQNVATAHYPEVA